MLAFAKQWMNMSKDERLNLTKDQLRYFTDPEFTKILRKQIIDSERKKYMYMLTFTLDPKKNEITEDLESTVSTLIENQSNRDALKITYFAYSKEYTKAKLPHWHVVIVTLKPLKKDRFQFYTKKYGNLDLSRTNGTTPLEALNYISKDVEPKVLIQ